MKKKIGAGLIVILLAFIYYYVTLPAVNIHESGFWVFLGGLVLLILVIYGFRKRVTSIYQLRSEWEPCYLPRSSTQKNIRL